MPEMCSTWSGRLPTLSDPATFGGGSTLDLSSPVVGTSFSLMSVARPGCSIYDRASSPGSSTQEDARQ